MSAENSVYADTAYRGSQCPRINEIYQANLLEHLLIDSQLIWHNQYSYKSPIHWQFPSHWYKKYSYQVQHHDFPTFWSWTDEAFKAAFDEDKTKPTSSLLFTIMGSFLSFPLAWIWIIACWLGSIVTMIAVMEVHWDVLLSFLIFPPIVACFGTYLNYWVTDKELRCFERYRWNGEGCYRRTGKVKHAYIGEANFTDCVPVVEHNVMTNGTTHLRLAPSGRIVVTT